MALTLTATRTAADAYDFTVAGLLPAESPTFTIDYGDGTAPATITTNASGTTVVHRLYTVAGHHDYTVKVTAGKTPLATTLAQLANLGVAQTPQSIFPSTAANIPGGDDANYNMGIEFTVMRPGQLTAIKFSKSTTGTATSRKVQLWDKASMTTAASRLYEWTTSGETASGWQTFTLPTPIDLVAGKTYVVSWQTVDKLPYLTPIPARNPNADVQFERFTYSAWPAPPTSTYLNNYSALVDVVFVPFAQGADQQMFPDTLANEGSAAANFEMGQRFTPKRAGRIVAARWFKPPSDAINVHTFNLWRHSDQVKLASVASSGESGSGWKRFNLVNSMLVAAGTEYTMSVTINSGTMSYRFGLPPASVAPDLTTGRALSGQPPGNYPSSNSNDFYMVDVIYRTDADLASLAALPGWPTLGSWAATTQTASVVVAVDVGPATIWASVVAGDPIPAIQVDALVSGGQNVIAWEISREQATDSTSIYVGSAWQSAVSFVDELAPLGVPVRYRLRLTYADYTSAMVYSNTVTITGTSGCYLTDPATGVTVAVTLVTWPERERDARRAVLSVLNRADPIALSDQHTTPAGDWTFYTATDAETLALLTLLTASTFAALRTQPGSSIATVTVSVGKVNERRYSGRGGDPRRFVDVEIQEIEPLPATALPLNATLGGLAIVDGDTLGTLSQFRDTLLQLSMVVTGVAEETGQLAPNV